MDNSFLKLKLTGIYRIVNYKNNFLFLWLYHFFLLEFTSDPWIGNNSTLVISMTILTTVTVVVICVVICVLINFYRKKFRGNIYFHFQLHLCIFNGILFCEF